MQKTWNWVNQYIDRIRDKPDYVLSLRRDDDREKVRAAIQLKAKEFHSLVIELGSGSGGHLIEHAIREPQSFFVGFELRFKRAFRTAEKAEQVGLKNIFMVNGQAAYLADLFEPHSIDTIYMNFPDPWEKKRWQKHRMINAQTIETFANVLKDEGVFSHKTDHPGYFEESLKLFEQSPSFKIERTSRNLHQESYANQMVKSEFEQLFISKGIPACYLEARHFRTKK